MVPLVFVQTFTRNYSQLLMKFHSGNLFSAPSCFRSYVRKITALGVRMRARHPNVCRPVTAKDDWAIRPVCQQFAISIVAVTQTEASGEYC